MFLCVICCLLSSCYHSYLIHQAWRGGKVALACEYDGKSYCTKWQILYYLEAPKDVLFYDRMIYNVPDKYEEIQDGVYDWKNTDGVSRTSPIIYFKEKIKTD